jgi:PPP family 3-phenylpropionic acid transporter
LSKASTLRAYYFASFASIGIFLPFISPWLYALGVRGTILGVISATRPLAGVIAPVLFGWLADSLGLRGSILKLACFGAMLPFFVLSFLAWQGIRFSWLLLLLAVTVSSFFRVPMMTIADVSALEHQKSYGSLRLWGSVGFMVAGLLAGKIIDPTEPFLFPTAVALAYLFSFALTFRFPARVTVPRKPKRTDLVQLLRHPSFTALLLTATVWSGSHVAYDLCISLHLKQFGASPFTTSVAWTIGVVGEIALMAAWTTLKGRWNSENFLKLGLFATLVRFIGLSYATNLHFVLWLQPLHAFSFAMVWMAMMDLVHVHAPQGLLGSAQGLFSAATSLGAAFGMLVFAPLYERFGGSATFIVAAFVALLALVTSHLTSVYLTQPEEARS